MRDCRATAETEPDPRQERAMIVVGASVRGMAQSARRAGMVVHAADLFGDADLRSIARTVVRLGTVFGGPPYPDGLPEAVRTMPVVPFCYTGGLENHPDLVDALARDRPLAGNPGAALKAVRDHGKLAAAVRSAGLGYPDTRLRPDDVPRDGSFLVKPRHSAGGGGIAAWHRETDPRPREAGLVWQRRVAGKAWAAAFVCHRGKARLYAVSRQLVGEPWCRARAFSYCGSLDVPLIALPAPARRQLDALGQVLAGHFELVGLVGADLIIDRRGRVHVIEINPRPTASMELGERATGESMATTHLAACGFGRTRGRRPMPTTGIWAKAVVFVVEPRSVDGPLAARLAFQDAMWTARDGGWPALADFPEVGERLSVGAPLVSVFARGTDARAARRALRRRVTLVVQSLEMPPNR
jgi:predicted ATP-grasp superfamily ATP-dependent carboligase